ncbi:hypothetical protein [Achromobacter sp. Marseille-Q4954]|uniref:hypothetical protein n=1 Tax=Achromobacter sp. Marseille-Q4954 TaxID=2942203 RepID=UPI002074673C|nr:hypothetical protein [Achromobacter sp. Marseille-Q4954]
MRNKLTPVAVSVSHFVRSNTRFALGIAVGVSVMFAGYAVSAVSSGSGSILGNASSQLLSQQTSVVADSIKADAEACATGTQDGSIGHSIQQAMQIHQTIAAAPVNVESLFDVNSDCFSGLNQIYDLSFSIPSLASIVGAASDAVMKYAQKKVCTAVNQVSGLVTSPINQAIDKINGMGAFGDLNGLTNGLVQQGMAHIDPNIAAGYSNNQSGGTYTVGTNPFGSSQVDFGGSTGTNGDMGSTNAQINSLNQQIANVQAQVGPAQYQLQQAQQQLSNCQAYQYNNCTSYQQQVANAQNHLNTLNGQLATLQTQLGNTSPSIYGTQTASARSAPAAAPKPAASDSSSFIQSIGNLFN